MSQEKVNRYKEEKANRKANLRRDRIKNMVRKIVVLVLSIALVGWVLISAIDTYQANRPRDMVTVNYGSIFDYLQALADAEAEPEIPEDWIVEPEAPEEDEGEVPEDEGGEGEEPEEEVGEEDENE